MGKVVYVDVGRREVPYMDGEREDDRKKARKKQVAGLCRGGGRTSWWGLEDP